MNIKNVQSQLKISWYEYKSTTFLVSDTLATTFDWIPITSLDQNATVTGLPEGIYRAEVSDGCPTNGVLRTISIIISPENCNT